MLALLQLLFSWWTPLAIFVLLFFHLKNSSEAPRLYYSRHNPDAFSTQLLAALSSSPSSCLKRNYYPPPYLTNGHMHTVFSSLFGFTRMLPVPPYSRELLYLEADDYTGRFPNSLHGVIALDSLPPSSSNPPNGAWIVLVPGLTGDSASPYIRNYAVRFAELGYRVTVVNYRGSGGVELITAQAYNGAYTHDLRQALWHIRKRASAEEAENGSQQPMKIFAIAFSLGANVLLRYLGEDEDRVSVDGAVAVSAPYDLYTCSHKMHSSLFRRAVYSLRLKDYLIELFEKHAKWFPPPADQSPVACQNNVSYDVVRQAKNLRHFDELMTRRAFGYATVDCYYRDANSAQNLPKIAVPTLCLTALDDPICDLAGIPYAEAEANGNIILAVTQCGGHSMDFYEGFFANRSWSLRAAAQFIRQVRTMSLSPTKKTWTAPLEYQARAQEKFSEIMDRLAALETRLAKTER